MEHAIERVPVNEGKGTTVEAKKAYRVSLAGAAAIVVLAVWGKFTGRALSAVRLPKGTGR